jgi:hypothetical protein
MDFTKQTKKIMTNAIKRYSLENEKGNKQTQLMINSEEDFSPTFKVLIDNKPVKDVSFKEIINVKLDLLNKEAIATQFITMCLQRICRENECNYNEVNILIYSPDELCEEIMMYLFIGTKPVKEITFNYLFMEDLTE